MWYYNTTCAYFRNCDWTALVKGFINLMMLKTATLVTALVMCAAPALAQSQMIPSPPRKPMVCEEQSLQTGIASVYANLLEGNRTANGETFRQSAFTAAHPTLPFNTLLQVKDRSTGRSVMVRINDRGPFVAGRILDLSSAARRALGHKASGLMKVSLNRCSG